MEHPVGTGAGPTESGKVADSPRDGFAEESDGDDSENPASDAHFKVNLIGDLQQQYHKKQS